VKALRALRGPIVVIAAAVALGVSGCATADTAAIVNGHTISEREAQEAARQIQEAQPDSGLDTGGAVSSLIMAQFINEVADKVGKGLSDSAARAAVETIEDPSSATLELVKASVAWNNLSSDERNEAIADAQKAKITINPRYGTFDAKTMQFDVSKPNWIKAQPTTSPTG
jgi:hypothetical protein